LIHSDKEFGDGHKYKTPQHELEESYEPGIKWQWRWGQPLREDEGPFSLLFAWEKRVFGYGTASVTRSVDSEDYNFAFVLDHYEERKPVALADLGLGKRSTKHHGLIRLDSKILELYSRLSSCGPVFLPK
jgi:hypothetical protein